MDIHEKTHGFKKSTSLIFQGGPPSSDIQHIPQSVHLDDGSKIDVNKYKLESTFDLDQKSVLHHEYKDGIWRTTRWFNTDTIGEGGFGSVLLQRSEEGQLRAVKRLYKPDKKFREVTSLIRVMNRTDLFIRFLGWYEQSEDTHFIAMEYIEHGDLHGYLQREAPIPDATARCITEQVLQGLVVLEKMRTYHRDLKPRNILLTCLFPLKVKICDFGASKSLYDTALRTNVGTHGYCAPENTGFIRMSPRSPPTELVNTMDIWSLGCIVYEMVTRKPPFFYYEDETTHIPSGVAPGLPAAGTRMFNMQSFLSFVNGDIALPLRELEEFKASEGAKAFIQLALQVDNVSRPTSAKALNWLDDGWMSGASLPMRGDAERELVRKTVHGINDAINESLGILPLTVTALQGYHQVPTFVSSQRFNADCSSSEMRRVKVLGDRSVQPALLDDLNSPHWQEDGLNTRLEKSLGDYLDVVKGVIKNISDPLTKMHDSQLHWERSLGAAVAPVSPPPSAPVVRGRARALRWIISIMPEMALRAAGLYTPEQSSEVIKGYDEDLRILLHELRDHISDLESISHPVSMSPLVTNPSQAEEDESRLVTLVSAMTTARRLVHATSVRLHRAISKSLFCQCHTVYLCLDGQIIKPAAAGDQKGTFKQLKDVPNLEEIRIQFSFLFTSFSGVSASPGATLVCFQPDGSGGIDAVATSPCDSCSSVHNNICAEVASQSEGYERWVHDPSDNGGGGDCFRLCLKPSFWQRGDSTSRVFVSLQQLIMTRARYLTVYNRFLMTISLAQSLLHLYSSPWIQDWSIETIFFYPEAQDGVCSKFGQWTPYLALRPDLCDIPKRNRDVYRLGHILLQLGSLSVDGYQVASELGVRSATVMLSRSMGKNYAAFVESCLIEWGQNSEFDLTRGEHLTQILMHLEKLRIDARCFEEELSE